MVSMADKPRKRDRHSAVACGKQLAGHWFSVPCAYLKPCPIHDRRPIETPPSEEEPPWPTGSTSAS